MHPKQKKSETESERRSSTEKLLVLPEQAVNLLILKHFIRKELIFDRTLG